MKSLHPLLIIVLLFFCSCQTKQALLKIGNHYNIVKYSGWGIKNNVNLEFSESNVYMWISRESASDVYCICDTGSWIQKNDTIYVRFDNISVHRQLQFGPYVPSKQYIFVVKGEHELIEIQPETKSKWKIGTKK